MRFLRHLPTPAPESLNSLIQYRPNQVCSMSLYQSQEVQITLLAFDKEEGVSEELYPGDTLFFMVDGEMTLTAGAKEHLLKKGQVMAIPAGVLHSLKSAVSFKILQITAVTSAN